MAPIESSQRALSIGAIGFAWIHDFNQKCIDNDFANSNQIMGKGRQIKSRDLKNTSNKITYLNNCVKSNKMSRNHSNHDLILPTYQTQHETRSWWRAGVPICRLIVLLLIALRPVVGLVLPVVHSVPQSFQQRRFSQLSSHEIRESIWNQNHNQNKQVRRLWQAVGNRSLPFEPVWHPVTLRDTLSHCVTPCHALWGGHERCMRYIAISSSETDIEIGLSVLRNPQKQH